MGIRTGIGLSICLAVVSLSLLLDDSGYDIYGIVKKIGCLLVVLLTNLSTEIEFKRKSGEL